MQFGFYFDQTRCVGCFTCAVACKDWHDTPAGPSHWMKVNCIEEGEFPHPAVAYAIRPCYHCENPPCRENCPAGAISKSADTGIVTVDRGICLGQEKCGTCREICPYGAPQFGAETDARMEKCDLCRERWQGGGKPICVEACPLRALDAGEMVQLEQQYGRQREMDGFPFDASAKPSVIWKRK